MTSTTGQLKLTKRHARRVLEVVDAGLTEGLGNPVPGEMCVEAAICYALGLPHGDDPECVAECVRRYKIRLNDAKWSSNEARAKGMRRAAIAQLGSEGIDQRKWAEYVAEQTIRRIVPEALCATASKHKNKVHAKRLIAAAARCEQEGSKESAIAARDADAAAAGAAYAAYAADAAAYAAYAADAADADAYAAAAAAAAYAADAAGVERDRILNIAAEICVEACVLCKTPGSKWLDITQEDA
jgi:hypothetical protein